MFHHDSRDYEAAASEAAAEGRRRMEKIIEGGRAKAASVIEGVLGRVISDTVTPATLVRLAHSDDGGDFLSAAGVERPLHPYAKGQLLDGVGFPRSFAAKLSDEAGGLMWGKAAVANVVNEVLVHRTKDRHLVRCEGDTVKGFLSDRFRRLDSRPMVDSFCGACDELGLVPIDGVASDTKCRVRAVVPQVFEPIPNEVMLFGAELGNSDYGDGGLVVNLWTMRVWCTNLAVAEKCLRTVHLGARLPDNVSFAEDTYRRDAEATALAVRDITRSVVSPDRVNRMLKVIAAAGEKEIREVGGIDKILGRTLEKGEMALVKGVYESEDVVNLPPGNTLWRLSNAVSWVAQGKGVNADRKIELQHLAGKIVCGDKEAAAAV